MFKVLVANFQITSHRAWGLLKFEIRIIPHWAEVEIFFTTKTMHFMTSINLITDRLVRGAELENFSSFYLLTLPLRGSFFFVFV